MVEGREDGILFVELGVLLLRVSWFCYQLLFFATVMLYTKKSSIPCKTRARTVG